MLTKEQILFALNKFARQRPGLEFCNYGDASAYRSELRAITRDLAHARELARAVEWSGITAEQLTAAFRNAYSGRLSIREENGRAVLDYCTGQYWPTEYRRAVCAVLSSALWSYKRDYCMPAPQFLVNGKVKCDSLEIAKEKAKEFLPKIVEICATYKGKSAGEYLRAQFRKEFGRAIASTWFN